MAKFEEELNKIEVEVQTPLDKYIVEKATSDESLYAQHYEAVLEKFKDWHSDEEFQELLSKYSGLNHNYEKEVIRSSKLETSNLKLISEGNGLLSDNATLTKEIANLKSQLKQQALPVVPEDVDEAIKYLKNHNNSTFSDLGDILTNKGFKWLNDFQFKDRRFGFGGLNNKLFILSHLAITGYTVEKPQRKRYEVKLLSGESMYFNPIGNPKNIKDYRFSFGNHAGWKTKFTKSELAEIKDGMFLKRIPGGTPLDDLGKDKSYYVWLDDCNYWINPLIELVPVEDGE